MAKIDMHDSQYNGKNTMCSKHFGIVIINNNIDPKTNSVLTWMF